MRIPAVSWGTCVMDAETLDAEYYRQQALLCHTLAKVASEARPLFARLHSLAKAYEAKAEAAERSKMLLRASASGYVPRQVDTRTPKP
jgi:hypothetical protein